MDVLNSNPQNPVNPVRKMKYLVNQFPASKQIIVAHFLPLCKLLFEFLLRHCKAVKSKTSIFDKKRLFFTVFSYGIILA
jgi:hypothetical protein